MDQSKRYLRTRSTPKLRSPVLIAAFAGWNDAAEVATHATQFLVRRLGAERFADIDPEEFFVFSEQRPQVRIDEGSQRLIEWPINEFYYREAMHGERDCIILIGTEPQMRWRTFVDAILTHAIDLGASLVVTLGGLLADVPHSRAPRLTGSSTDPALAERLGRTNVRTSRYEGPTGILGVLNNECKVRGVPSASIWGNVPHYIGGTPNPKVTSAILHRLDDLLGFDLDLSEIDESVVAFEEQVREAIGRDPEAQAYVRQLELREDQGLDEDAPAQNSDADLPSGEEMVRELEEFLKRRDDEAK